MHFLKKNLYLKIRNFKTEGKQIRSSFAYI